jgi:hypothetical protein
VYNVLGELKKGVDFFNKYLQFREDFNEIFFEKGKPGWLVTDFTCHKKSYRLMP